MRRIYLLLGEDVSVEVGKYGHEFGCEYGGNVADPMRCNFTVY